MQARSETALPGPIRFHTSKPGFVSLSLFSADGKLVRPILSGTRMEAGDHQIKELGQVPPGEYTWKAVIHDGLALKLNGWIGDFGGNKGTPSAVAADSQNIFLGWSLATAGGASVVSCEPDGKIRWTHHRGALSGCRALAVDEGLVYVLGGEGDNAQGGALYRLSAKDGSLVPWPDGRGDLPISSLWPADGTSKPGLADYLAVNNGRIYLSFTKDEFAAVLDARSGAYLQTLVGAPPGAISAVATKSDTPEHPNEMVEADFVVTALKGGTLGKLLLVHDPIWVVASDLSSMNRNEKITALAMMGDSAKHHRQDIFYALGFPFNQVQARSALESEGYSFVAGESGGRPNRGKWAPKRMSFIRGIGLDGTGQLWVAEGAGSPKRISVWSTDGELGKLRAEYFAPPDNGSPVAIHPRDPRVMFADGCEWRIDPKTGRAACTGIVTPNPVRTARFLVEGGKGIVLVLSDLSGAEQCFERVGEGEYRPGPVPKSPNSTESPVPAFCLSQGPSGAWCLVTPEGISLGSVLGAAKISAPVTPPPGDDWPLKPSPAGSACLAQLPDGRVFLAAGSSRIWNFEVKGLETVRPLHKGTIQVAR
jgi:hypothetical protein